MKHDWQKALDTAPHDHNKDGITRMHEAIKAGTTPRERYIYAAKTLLDSITHAVDAFATMPEDQLAQAASEMIDGLGHLHAHKSLVVHDATHGIHE